MSFDSKNVDVNLSLEPDVDNSIFIQDFTIDDVRMAVFDIKRNRAISVDELPGEVLKNNFVISFLH